MVYDTGSFLLFPPWDEYFFKPIDSTGDFGPLNSSRGVYILRANGAAFAHKGTFPDSFLASNDFLTGVPSLVPGVQVVPLAKGDGSGTYEGGIKRIDGTGSVAEHAVDAH